MTETNALVLTKLYRDNAYPSKTAFGMLARANGFTTKQANDFLNDKTEPEVFDIVKP